MRPHRLRVVAFGAFAGEVRLDLDALAGDGLFLLHGQTGAGKTTLLDAIGFALYGRVPGVRGKAGRLRSDHAAPGVRTEVELEVTVGGRRLRLTRSPAWERPKARGTGTTTEPARVHLQELRGQVWESRSERIDETALELDPLLGMSADQFFQVVLLPQGEFAKFLRADSKERGELLQRLFGTERFKAVEDWLAAHRIATAAALATGRHELEVLAGRVAQVAGTQVPQELSEEWVRQAVQGAAQDLHEAQRQVVAALSGRDAARVTAAECARVHDLQRRRGEALARQAQLAAGDGDRLRLRRELGDAVRAGSLVGLLDAADQRTRECVAGERAQARARADLPAAGLPMDAPVVQVRAAADLARRRTGRLEALHDLASSLGQEQQAAERAHREATTHGRAWEDTAALLATLPARRSRAVELLSRATGAAEGLPAARERAGLLTVAVREATGLSTVTGQLAALREEHLSGRETLVSLREKESELRDARVTSMLAELADRLEDGAPCEVCGSVAHPDPYLGVGDAVTRDDEDRARLAAEQAAHELAHVQAQQAAQQALATEHRERLAAAGYPDTPLAELVEQLQQAQARVSDLRPVAAGAAEATATLTEVDREQSAATARLATLDTERAAAQRRHREAAGRAEALSGRLLSELEGAPDITAALAEAARSVSVCDSVLVAAGEAERAAVEAAASREAVSAAAAAAGFVEVALARAAVRAEPWRADAEQRLRAAADQQAAVLAALADPELHDLPGVAVDVDLPAAALRARDEHVQEVTGRRAAAQGRHDGLTLLRPDVEAAVDRLGPLTEQACLARRMADLCAGGGANALRMTLTSFVLAARLEQVAEAASGHLLAMTQDRFSLAHSDGAAKGGARSGLGLLARDAWTGQDRETSTLSGGETFQASLALALGLADVVQEEAGGARIEALFVDEGFGSLDEQTLDEVMDVLDSLRAGGRLVGVVSHVSELRDRIPTQVHVRKGRRGSDLEVLTR